MFFRAVNITDTVKPAGPVLSVRSQTWSNTGDGTTVTSFMTLSSGNDDHAWRFVTNHGHVLECIATNPTARLRDVAATVGITERTAAQIVNDLEKAGYVTKTRVGRNNRYEIHAELPLRHPQHRHRTVGELIRFLARSQPAASAPSATGATGDRDAPRS